MEGLEEAHWWLLAPLLRNRALRPPIDQRSWWISLLLRAIDAPALGILRKQDALVLAKRLLKARCTGTSDREGADVTQTFMHQAAVYHHKILHHQDGKRQLTALLGAMERAHGFDVPTRAVCCVWWFFSQRRRSRRVLSFLLIRMIKRKLFRIASFSAFSYRATATCHRHARPCSSL